MREPWYRQWWFVIMVIFFTVGIIVNVNKRNIETMVNQSVDASSAINYYPIAGDIILLGRERQQIVVVARNPLYLVEYKELIEQDNIKELEILEDKNRLFLIHDYTVALVMEVDSITQIVKLRILEDQHYGEAGYTNLAYCKVKKTVSSPRSGS